MNKIYDMDDFLMEGTDYEICTIYRALNYYYLHCLDKKCETQDFYWVKEMSVLAELITKCKMVLDDFNVIFEEDK